MRSKVIALALICLTATALLLSVPALAASRSRNRTADMEAASTPEARAFLWQRAFERYLERHPEISPEHRDALLEASAAAEEDWFVANPTPEARENIRATLKALGETVACSPYSEIVNGFGALGGWLQSIGSDPLKTVTYCNCNNNNDCLTGYVCVPGSCTIPTGTNHNGICKKQSASICPLKDYSGGCIQIIVWAKDPETGLCCQYPNPCVVPDGWQIYYNSACEE